MNTGAKSAWIIFFGKCSAKMSRFEAIVRRTRHVTSFASVKNTFCIFGYQYFCPAWLVHTWARPAAHRKDKSPSTCCFVGKVRWGKRKKNSKQSFEIRKKYFQKNHADYNSVPPPNHKLTRRSFFLTSCFHLCVGCIISCIMAVTCVACRCVDASGRRNSRFSRNCSRRNSRLRPVYQIELNMRNHKKCDNIQQKRVSNKCIKKKVKQVFKRILGRIFRTTSVTIFFYIQQAPCSSLLVYRC